MGRRVFNTEYAPPEEIEGVKVALEAAGIAFYEIKNSRLWLGGGSLCVSDPEDYDRARAIIDKFQDEWRANARRNPVEPRLNWRSLTILLIIFAMFIFVTIKSLGA